MNILITLFNSIICWTVCSANATDVNIPFDHFHTEPILPFNTWGTFRGYEYFGFKSTSPDSPVVGLIWFTNSAKDVESLQMRHWCDINDNVTYGWKSHNFQDFGFQTIVDNNYKLDTSFLKYSPNEWKALISTDSIDHIQTEDESLSLIIYTSIERSNDFLKISNFNSSGLQINGFNEYNANFSIDISSDDENLLYTGYLDSESSVVDIIKTLKHNLHEVKVNSTKIFALKNTKTPNNSRLIALQVVIKSQSKVKIDFNSKHELNNNNNIEDFEQELQKRIKSFDKEFEMKFSLREKGFNESQVSFAQSVLSEMIGSIIFTNGNLSVISPGMTNATTYGPLQMLSAIPSRPIFPRPFLWDEGFHNLLIQRWNSSLTLTIMKSWFNIMNIKGWIPREITLGDEGVAKFGWVNTQIDDNANPPSFLLTIDSLLNNNKIDVNYLKDIYPRLKTWFQWYNSSQVGEIRGTYRWRGRDTDLDNKQLNPDTVTSGLDDFPRATHPTDSEYHLDLRCWIALAADIMSRISEVVKDLTEKVKYEETAKLLSDNQLLDVQHWSEEHKAYCDYGLHSTNVSLVKDPKEGLIRKVWTEPKYQLTCDQLGYNNLFPLMFGLIDANNTKLGYVLDTIEDTSQMMSSFGLRSISKTSFYYNKYNREEEPPYWRGPIWINVNYLVLKGLRHYASIPGPYQQKAQKIYNVLRNNLMENMLNEYQRTGFVWEQYNDETGVGQRSHPFVGWSGVIVLIMAEHY